MIALVALMATACIVSKDGSSGAAVPQHLEPGEDVSPSPAADAPPQQIVMAKRHIKHIVFLIKENRTFDTMFGRFPGADGATTGQTCDGRTIPLAHAKDRTADVGHSFIDGLIAVDAGKMDCFAQAGYIQYQRADIPNYWRYAKRFTLADRFFSSVYGPTGIEHLWTFAAQSDRFVDHERPGQLGTARREFCDDPDEKAYSFPRMTQQQQTAMYQLEAQGASAAEQVRAAWWSGGRARTSRSCPTSSSVRVSRGTSTGAGTSSSSRCGSYGTCGSHRCTDTSSPRRGSSPT